MHEAGVQTVAGYAQSLLLPSQLPAQVALEATQAPCPARGVAFAPNVVHLPSEPATLHASQVPVQALSQQ